MSDKTHALELADWLDDQYDPTGNFADSATELRRLDASEAAMLEALEKLATVVAEAWEDDRQCVRIALEIIARTKESRNG